MYHSRTNSVVWTLKWAISAQIYTFNKINAI